MKIVKGAGEIWKKYSFAALAVLIGVGLLLWPEKETRESIPLPVHAETGELEKELEQILGKISGVGAVEVMVTLESGGERRLAQDSELSFRGSVSAPEDYTRRSQIVFGDGREGDEAVVVKELSPTYRGALVVCQGGDRPEVKLKVTEAVAALTGLPSDRVTVAKWQ